MTEDPYADIASPEQAADPYAGVGQEEAPSVTHVAHTFATRGPDGKEVRFEAPADADDETIRAAAAKATGSKAYLASAVKRDGSPLPDTRQESFGQGVLEGIEQPINHMARWADNGIRAVGGGGVLDAINQWSAQHLGTAPSVDVAEQNQQQYNDAQDVRGSGLGKFAGNVAATLPLSGLGVLAGGAVGGAALSDDQSAAGIAKGAALGGVGSVVGDRVLRGAAAVIAPRVAPALQTLIDAGVRVTPGQIARSTGTRAGRYAAGVEDLATSLPLAGQAIQGARRQAQDDFGAATVNRALEPIGESLPQGVRGRDAVAHAGDRLSQAYNDVTPRLSATGDAPFQQDLQAIHQEAGNLVGARQEQFNNILTGLGRFWQNGQHIDGQAFKDIETRLGQHIADFGRSQDADQQQLGRLLQNVQQSVRDLAARQNPQEAARIADINRGWAGLAQVEKAAGNSRADISPAGYSQAVKQSSNTVRRRGYARGTALNQDLSDAASEILPSSVADSGTGGRLGLLALGATGARALTGDPAAIGGLGAVAATGAAYTQPAQSAIRWALTHPSSPQAQAIANLIRQGSRPATLAAPAAIAGLTNGTGQ